MLIGSANRFLSGRYDFWILLSPGWPVISVFCSFEYFHLVYFETLYGFVGKYFKPCFGVHVLDQIIKNAVRDSIKIENFQLVTVFTQGCDMNSTSRYNPRNFTKILELTDTNSPYQFLTNHSMLIHTFVMAPNRKKICKLWVTEPTIVERSQKVSWKRRYLNCTII